MEGFNVKNLIKMETFNEDNGKNVLTYHFIFVCWLYYEEIRRQKDSQIKRFD